MSKPLVCFDLETGGLDIATAPIIQMAAVVMEDGKEVMAWERKVAFDADLAEPRALEINHYDHAVWQREAVSRRQALHELYALCSRNAWVQQTSKAGYSYKVAMLCGHNAVGYDFPILQREFSSYSLFLPAAYSCVLDTLHLARWRFWDTERRPSSFSLEALCAWYEIALPGAHDALCDARAVAQIIPLLRGENQ